MFELKNEPKLFIGFKIDSLILRELRFLEESQKKYVSASESMFLSLAKRGKENFIGKVLDEPLSTDRVDDVRRNIVSILQKLIPETRLPEKMDILPLFEVAEPVEDDGSVVGLRGIEPRFDG